MEDRACARTTRMDLAPTICSRPRGSAAIEDEREGEEKGTRLGRDDQNDPNFDT